MEPKVDENKPLSPRLRAARLGLAVFATAVTVGLVEAVSAWLYPRVTPPNGRRLVDIYLGRQSSVPGSIVPHPYLLYGNAPRFHDGKFGQFNSLGYRNPEFPVEKPAGTIRVLVLGGSTTHVWPFISNPKDTWVARLEDGLRRQTGKDIQVINAGIPYGTTAELLAGWTFRHRFLSPDVVIFHEGGNDVVPVLSGEYDPERSTPYRRGYYDPEYTHFRFHGVGTAARPGERAILRSHFMQIVYARWLANLPAVYRSVPNDYSLIDRDRALARVQANPGEGFRRNLDYLIKLVKADGAKMMIFGFLQARKENLAKNKPTMKGLEEATDLGVKKNYVIMRELAVKHQVPMVEPNQDLFDDAWFVDNCHLNEQGEAVKAKIMLEAFNREKLLEGIGAPKAP